MQQQLQRRVLVARQQQFQQAPRAPPHTRPRRGGDGALRQPAQLHGQHGVQQQRPVDLREDQSARQVGQRRRVRRGVAVSPQRACHQREVRVDPPAVAQHRRELSTGLDARQRQPAAREAGVTGMQVLGLRRREHARREELRCRVGGRLCLTHWSHTHLRPGLVHGIMTAFHGT